MGIDLLLLLLYIYIMVLTEQHITDTNNEGRFMTTLSYTKQTKEEAKEELKGNINVNFCHAVILENENLGYFVELHAGHAGNCCCDSDADFVWREDGVYTTEEEIDEI